MNKDNLETTHESQGRRAVSTRTEMKPPRQVSNLGSIGRYYLLRELGRGGMGAVYEAYDPATDRNVAVKVILGNHANPRTLARFKQEARITALLEHPSIVPAHDIGEANGKLFMVMKLVRGKTFKALALKSSTSRQTLGPVLDAFRKLCDAVAFMHSKNIIHRDLKPDNVMVGEHGEVQLMDMGICKILGEQDISEDEVPTLERLERDLPQLTLQGTVIGTPSYMSPEQARGQIDQLDARSDVYSLGAILYFILTGQPPFSGKQSIDVLKAVRAGKIKPLRTINPSVPVELESIVLRAMHPVQKYRYASATDLRMDIERYVAGGCPLAHKDSVLSSMRREIQNHPGRAAGLAAAILVLITALAALVLVRSAESERWNAELLAMAERAEKERAALQAEQARQREMIQTGRADDLAKELGITVKAEKVAAVKEMQDYIESQQQVGVNIVEAMSKATNEQIEFFMNGLIRMIDIERRTGIQLVTPRDYLNLGYVYLFTFKAPDRAEIAAKKALERDPQFVPALALLGYTAQANQRWVDLENVWRRVLATAEGAKMADAYVGVAAGLYGQSKYAEALPYYKQFFRMTPKSTGQGWLDAKERMDYCQSVVDER